MPYNYPVLLPLLDDLFKIHRCKPTREWKQQFDNYLKNMPLYYAAPLKRALQKMGPPNLVHDTMENCLSYNVLNYLKRLKNQAKTEFEKLICQPLERKRQYQTGYASILRHSAHLAQPLNSLK
ncbi:Integrator complex subunit 6-A, partial [Stegodyphus mimosarum]